ncbi:hypothetical protein LC55x_0557 [Lysobacter capsici]|nr:hypothetical protein LC55x_0557 [Lysobacter capsici]
MATHLRFARGETRAFRIDMKNRAVKISATVMGGSRTFCV